MSSLGYLQAYFNIKESDNFLRLLIKICRINCNQINIKKSVSHYRLAIKFKILYSCFQKGSTMKIHDDPKKVLGEILSDVWCIFNTLAGVISFTLILMIPLIIWELSKGNRPTLITEEPFVPFSKWPKILTLNRYRILPIQIMATVVAVLFLTIPTSLTISTVKAGSVCIITYMILYTATCVYLSYLEQQDWFLFNNLGS